ncbi:Chitinase, GH18 family [Sphingomonas gellani]|uniref:chitinase n=1 Tax=Sphingomonas gellani TaxID=1166340 RepID=A0A1H8AW25_9SPHN|nr:glycosyl hydrolase family 18 protein [Sphingomonas gellani]SEM75021.1 Chitinase, GH18 family [Sphingomonas gellani]
MRQTLERGATWLIGAMLVTCGSIADAAPRSVFIGYMPASAGLPNLPAKKVLSRYSHVAIAFANPSDEAAFTTGDAMACMPGKDAAPTSIAQLRLTVDAVHRAGGKALISVGGGLIPSCSGDWTALLRGTARDRMVSGLVALVEAVNADGVDVDLEGELLNGIDRAGDYTPFVAAIGAQLHRRDKLLTCATASYEGGMIPQSAIPSFDFVSVMSYDRIGATWGQAGDEHSTFEKAEADIALWRQRGVPKKRLVLGVPFYGYGFGTYASSYGYRDLVSAFGSTVETADVIGNRCAGCSYITYNSRATLRRKAQLARNKAGGIMAWNVIMDTDDGRLSSDVGAALGRAPRN